MNDQQLFSLLSDMSLEEKVMQLVQLPGGAYDPTAFQTGISEETIPQRVRQLAGSTLSIDGADKLRDLQTRYMAAHPHHIPLLFMLDVVHGHKTVFPCPLGQGATFDPALIEEGASVQAAEAAADGIHVTFSPMCDLSRDARWGRVMESTGEDVLLNSRMAAAMVKGYQGERVDDGRHVASCIKHFAAYGGAEAGRDYQNVELSEHTLREKYLPAYRAAIDAGAMLVMSSFNTWNGIPASAHPQLMKEILRTEFGFDGVLISDYGAVREMVPHSYAEDDADAARKSMAATLDIDMCGACYSGHLEELVRSGKVPEQSLDKAVMRVLRLKNDLGLFEDPFRGVSAERLEALRRDPAVRASARKAVAESLVLLENKNEALPLRSRRIAFIGPYAENADIHSSWAISLGDTSGTVTVRKAAEEAFAGTGTEVRFAAGCTLLDQGTHVNVSIYSDPDWAEKNCRLADEAAEAAEWADTVVLCLGEHRGQTGESTSRVSLTLPEVQTDLLRRLAGTKKRIVTLVFCGRPLELKEAAALSDALMVCWLPGSEGGHGILDILIGRTAPSGKLPMSFPRAVGQEPLHYDQYPTGRPRPDDRYDAFTSRYLDCENSALYPFGYGLTYGEVRFSPVTLSGGTLAPDGVLTASADVTLTGPMPAEHTVQLYLRDVTGSRVRPVRELKDFRRVLLRPGETRTVSFEITEPMLRFWTAENRWASEPGRFRLWIGPDSASGSEAGFTLIG
ncbi:MAG: beta-glucosidase BglX [Clostridia bacterium]|nr:beta-glucosidase BglX [Clostridia bacterium]